MTVRHHYDAKGNYLGRSLNDADLGFEIFGAVLIVPLVLFFVVRWAYRGMLGYAKLAAPYKWFVGYYYFTVAVPYMWADKLFRVVMKSTQWPNLNFAAACLVFVATLLLPYALALALLSRLPEGGRLRMPLLLGPAALLIIWYAGDLVTEWLFAK